MNTSGAQVVHPEPKSYLTAEERRELEPYGNMGFFEAFAAYTAGDNDSCWVWMQQIDFCESAKRALKRGFGDEFLAEKGLVL